MASIRSKEYDVVEADLASDPIVIQMANEIPSSMVSDMLHEGGQPNMNLMLLSNKEFANRGGRVRGHIGAIAHAILKLKGLE